MQLDTSPHTEHSWIALLAQDPIIAMVREEYYPSVPSVPADSEEGQAMLGKIAQGTAYFMPDLTPPLDDWHFRQIPHSFDADDEDGGIILSDSIKAKLADRTVEMNDAVTPLQDEILDDLANNTGRGSERSRLHYMVNMLRDDIYSHRSRKEPWLTEDEALVELLDQPDPFIAYVHKNYPELVKLVKVMYRDPALRDEAYTVVENLGGSLFTLPGDATIYLHVDGHNLQL